MTRHTNLPIWLLDVDGVINVDSPQWGVKPRTGRAVADGQPYPFRWAQPLVDEIRSIRAEGLAEVVWCTTWCAYADELERLWDIDPPLRRAFPGGGYRSMTPAKIVAALDVVRSGRPLIWTDDDAIPTHGPTYVDLTRGDRHLLIAPRTDVGLTPRHVAQIREFCEKSRSERW